MHYICLLNYLIPNIQALHELKSVHASPDNLVLYTYHERLIDIQIGVKHGFFNNIKWFFSHVPHNLFRPSFCSLSQGRVHTVRNRPGDGPSATDGGLSIGFRGPCLVAATFLYKKDWDIDAPTYIYLLINYHQLKGKT